MLEEIQKLEPEPVPEASEIVPEGLREGEVEITDCGMEPDGSMRLILKHRFEGEDDSFAIYVSPDLSDRQLKKEVEAKVKERREFLKSVREQERARRQLEESIKSRIEKLKARKWAIL